MVALLLGQLDLALLRGKFLVGGFEFQQQLGVEVLGSLAVADVDDKTFEELELARIIPTPPPISRTQSGSPSIGTIR